MLLRVVMLGFTKFAPSSWARARDGRPEQLLLHDPAVGAWIVVEGAASCMLHDRASLLRYLRAREAHAGKAQAITALDDLADALRERFKA